MDPSEQKIGRQQNIIDNHVTNRGGMNGHENEERLKLELLKV
jgi:hypothetical protein